MGSWLTNKPQHRAVGRGEAWADLQKHFTLFEVFCVKLAVIDSMRSKSGAVVLFIFIFVADGTKKVLKIRSPWT